MATTLGFNGDTWIKALKFHARDSSFVINSKSGRFISLLYHEEIIAEVLFVEGIAGKFRLLGYQKLYGCRDENKHYKGGNLAVFL